jgi:ATP-dependent RNA helicase DHX29
MACVDAPSASWNAHSTHEKIAPILKAALTSALYPQIACKDSGASMSKRATWFDQSSAVAIHPSCMLHALQSWQFHSPYLVYSEKMQTSATYLRDVSSVSPMALLLFGGHMDVHHDAGYVLLDGWLKVCNLCNWKGGVPHGRPC